MSTTSNEESAAQATVGTTAAIAGLGTLTLALFPLAIPILALTAVAVAPLAILAIVPAVLVGIVVGAALAIRALARAITDRPRSPRRLPASARLDM
jgi:hypothetical protein